MDTGYLLMNISKQLKYALNQALLQKGLTVQQWAVIQQLSRKKLTTSVELSHRLDMDKPTISGIVKRLEGKELIEKIKNPSDQRSYFLQLTPLGKEKLKSCKTFSEQLVEKRLSVFSSTERKTLNMLLTRLNHDYEKETVE